AAFRTLARTAADLDLPDPVASLDPQAPVSGTFLAFLADRYGLELGRKLTAKDVSDFRWALAGRWRDRPTPLSADELRFYLSELWASGAAPLPERGLRPLGGLWPAAASWLEKVSAEDRG